MIRQQIIPQQRQYVIQFPEEMIGKPATIIAYSTTEDFSALAPEQNYTDQQPENKEELLAYLRKTGFYANGWKFDRNEANNYDD